MFRPPQGDEKCFQKIIREILEDGTKFEGGPFNGPLTRFTRREMDDRRKTEPGLLASRVKKYPRKWVFL